MLPAGFTVTEKNGGLLISKHGGSVFTSKFFTSPVHNMLFSLVEALMAQQPAICVKPACGPNCCDCNCAVSESDARQYVRRYAYLRERDLNAIQNGGVFAGLTPDNIVLNGADLDAAIDRCFAGGNAQQPTPTNPPGLYLESGEFVPAGELQGQTGSGYRPSRQWYARMIQDTLDDDFVIGPVSDGCTPVAQPAQEPATQPAPTVRCDCHRCIYEHSLTDDAGFPLSLTKMILCPTCRNKRCPKASDHRLTCTGSNQPGQAGSVYGGPREGGAA